MAGVHRVPSVQFGYGAEVYEPVHLDGFPQIARCMGRHPAAYVGNLLQLPLSLLVGFLGCHLLGQLGMALGKQDGGVA